jgi:hypothetical protein
MVHPWLVNLCLAISVAFGELSWLDESHHISHEEWEQVDMPKRHLIDPHLRLKGLQSAFNSF